METALKTQSALELTWNRGQRTENAMYNVIAARWRPVEAHGGRIENAIYNRIATRWRPVEADGGQVEAAQDMQITIVRTRTETSGDSKLSHTIIGITSLRPHQHQIINQLSIHRILSHNSPQVPFPFRFYSTSTTPHFSFLAPPLPISLLWSKIHLRFHSYHSHLRNFHSPTLTGQAKPSTTRNPKLPMTPMAQTEIPSYFPKLLHIHH